MPGRDSVLRVLLPALAAGKVRLCPRCCHGMFAAYDGKLDRKQSKAKAEQWWPMPPALSRTDNKTYVCSPCGTEEALEDALSGAVMAREDWGPRFLDDPDNGTMTNEGEATHE